MQNRTVFLNSRFTNYEMDLLSKIAELEKRKKSEVLRELVRKEAKRQGLILEKAGKK